MTGISSVHLPLVAFSFHYPLNERVVRHYAKIPTTQKLSIFKGLLLYHIITLGASPILRSAKICILLSSKTYIYRRIKLWIKNDGVMNHSFVSIGISYFLSFFSICITARHDNLLHYPADLMHMRNVT
jgi:hypothetical protein